MTTAVGTTMMAVMTISALRSARVRILASIVGLLLVSTVASVLIVREILLVRLDDRIQAGLVQESREFRSLVGGRDPATGRRFGTDLEAIYSTFLRRNLPPRGEVLLTFVGDRPYRSTGGRSFPLDELASSYEDWTGTKRSVQGERETSAGNARFLAVPVVLGSRRRGTFVVLNFTRAERAEVGGSVRIIALVNLSVLLLASLAGWLVAGRVLAPLRELRGAAQSITETDLSRRIEVHGNDELAELGHTFNQMLDRLELALSTQRAFVDDASHELRTPITIVRGHLELMGDGAEEREQAMDVVMDELDRMTRIVNDLLVLARAERPDFLQLEEVRVADLADELLAKARGLGSRDWRLVGSAHGTLKADRHRLVQAVVNLAQNAVQHTVEGDRIEIGVEASPGWVELSVADWGPGIAPRDHERVFERFSRLGSGPRRSDGAGLGLAIASAIAEAHGGRAEVESERGRGSRFAILVPT